MSRKTSTTTLRHLHLDPEKVVTQRVLRGLRQRDLAEQVGISPGYLCDIERGRRLASPAVRVAIAQALGLSLLDLTKSEE